MRKINYSEDATKKPTAGKATNTAAKKPAPRKTSPNATIVRKVLREAAGKTAPSKAAGKATRRRTSRQ